MLTLIISRDYKAGAWLVKSSDPRVRELFGTDTLPTAYLPTMPADRVIAALQALNPGALVRLPYVSEPEAWDLSN